VAQVNVFQSLGSTILDCSTFHEDPVNEPFITYDLHASNLVFILIEEFSVRFYGA
jgi:hypothetical protein